MESVCPIRFPYKSRNLQPVQYAKDVFYLQRPKFAFPLDEIFLQRPAHAGLHVVMVDDIWCLQYMTQPFAFINPGTLGPQGSLVGLVQGHWTGIANLEKIYITGRASCGSAGSCEVPDEEEEMKYEPHHHIPTPGSVTEPCYCEGFPTQGMLRAGTGANWVLFLHPRVSRTKAVDGRFDFGLTVPAALYVRLRD
jgi:hypothetical protein